jgi:Major Facilitator Superfamily
VDLKRRQLTCLLTLLALSVFINYIDRGNLSIAAPLLKHELGISASQLGVLLSAFFWSYTALLFISGWLVDRFDVNLVLAAGFLIWSVATALTGLVHGFAMLLLMRLMLGIGESVAWPSCSKILAWHVSERNRGFANGVIIAGMKCGPAIGTFGAGLLVAKYGWRPVFIGIGLLSLAWLPAWMKWMPRGEATVRFTSVAPGVIDILRERSFWGTAAGLFCTAYGLYFMVTWLPFYLVHEQHLSMQGDGEDSRFVFSGGCRIIVRDWLAHRLLYPGWSKHHRCPQVGNGAGIHDCSDRVHRLRTGWIRVLAGMAPDSRCRLWNRRLGLLCLFSDACRTRGDWEMGRLTSRDQQLCGSDCASADRIAAGSDWTLSSRTCNHGRDVPVERVQLGVLGRSGKASDLVASGCS